MTLLRRKKTPTPPQKGLDIVRLAVRGLVAQRVARSAFKGYKFLRRLPLLLGLGAAAALASRLLKRGGAKQPDPPAWTPPAAASTPSPGPGPSAPNPAETAGTGTPPVGEPAAPAAPATAPDDGAPAAGAAAGDSPDDADLKP